MWIVDEVLQKVPSIYNRTGNGNHLDSLRYAVSSCRARADRMCIMNFVIMNHEWNLSFYFICWCLSLADRNDFIVSRSWDLHRYRERQKAVYGCMVAAYNNATIKKK